MKHEKCGFGPFEDGYPPERDLTLKEAQQMNPMNKQAYSWELRFLATLGDRTRDLWKPLETSGQPTFPCWLMASWKGGLFVTPPLEVALLG